VNDLSIIKTILDFGGMGAIAVMVLISYTKIVDKLTNIIINNTAAMTALADINRQNVDSVASHDRRVGDLAPIIQRIDANTIRMAQQMDASYHGHQTARTNGPSHEATAGGGE
jgi:hypothetical protein